MGSPHTSTANFYAWKIQNTDMDSASSLANESVDIRKNWSTFKLLIALMDLSVVLIVLIIYTLTCLGK